jgi:hypothetical protein
MATISTALQDVKARVARGAATAGRAPEAVWLLAVSKTFPPAAILEAAAAGQICFGESYVQEALEKIAALSTLPLEWHFIGPIQSNKTRVIAEHFHWVHSVDRLKIAERLSQARPAQLGPLQICLQVNISGEASKSGVAPDSVLELAKQVRALPSLKLRGLMAIPRPTDSPHEQRAQFRQVRELFEQLNAQGFDLDTLSMGMSDDLEAAIAEGATIVRVGSAIFGQRTKSQG